MAKFIPKGIFTDLFSEIGNMSELCPQIIEEAEPVLVEGMQNQIRTVIRHPDRSTGELIDSITASKPKKAKDGSWSGFVGPQGYSSRYYYKGRKKGRKYKLPNASKLVFMEYGTSRQKATQVLDSVVKNTEEEALARMQAAFERLTKI